MAANYWESTQYKHFLIDDPYAHPDVKYDLKRISKDDLILLHAYFATMLSRIGKALSIRQKHIATAIVFFKRFYLRNSFAKTEPFIVLITSMYVAGKIDEYPYNLQNVLQESTNVLKNSDPKILVQYENSDIAQFEFYLLDTMNCRLTVFHPYHPLAEYIEKYLKNALKDVAKQQAWNIINDCFRFDLVLTYPPHILAITAIYLSFAQNYESHGKIRKIMEDNTVPTRLTHASQFKAFFLNLDIDFEQVVMAAHKLIGYYELYQKKGLKDSNMVSTLKILNEAHANEPGEFLQQQQSYVNYLQNSLQNSYALQN